MPGFLEKMARLLGRAPDLPKPAVRLDEGGFSVMQGQKVLASMLWTDVRKIAAYKYDLLSCDEICVAAIGESEDSGIEVSEEWQGFGAFIAEMERRFPSIPEDWYGEVMVPAFARKETVLFERS